MLLLKHNFPSSQGDKSGQTPLILACKAGHKNVVHVLLSNNVDVLQCDNNGRSPLYFAAREGHLEVTKLLLNIIAIDSLLRKCKT
jgi:ankyrin repeat protein